LASGDESVPIPMAGGDEGAPIPISQAQINDLRRLLLRSLNDNQILILSHVEFRSRLITSILKELSEKHDVPISTLKLNAKILKELNLISYGTASNQLNAELSDLGRFVISLIEEEHIVEKTDAYEDVLIFTVRKINGGFKQLDDIREHSREILQY
jgi:hypothetical protein